MRLLRVDRHGKVRVSMLSLSAATSIAVAAVSGYGWAASADRDGLVS